MKEILFVIPTISCGGAEKGLIQLLKNLDYKKYKVDLMLFRNDDMYYLNEIPKEVNIIENDSETKLAFDHVKRLIKSPLFLKKINVVIYRVYETAIMKLRKIFRINSFYYNWKRLKKYVPNLQKKYDIAIGYLSGNSIYYVVDKVNASKKIGFFRTDFIKGGFDVKYDELYFKKLDCLFTVSDDLTKEIRELMPDIAKNVKTMYNIIDVEDIKNKARENIDFDKKYKGIKLVSVGNLRYVKGYDLAIESSAILKEKGYDFKWYIVGEGKERNNLEKKIKKYNLEDYFILLGVKKNPYAYIKQADIYIQLSRFEGLSTTIREAKALAKPIIITDCDGMKNQIKNETTGLITDYNPKNIAETIARLIDNKNERSRFESNLLNEENVTSKEKLLEIFYNEIN